MLAQAINNRLKNWSFGKLTQVKGTLSDLKNMQKKFIVAISTVILTEKRLIKVALYNCNLDTDSDTSSHVDSDASLTEKRQKLRSPKDAEDADDELEKSVKTGVSFRDCVCKKKKKKK